MKEGETERPDHEGILQIDAGFKMNVQDNANICNKVKIVSSVNKVNAV